MFTNVLYSSTTEYVKLYTHITLYLCGMHRVSNVYVIRQSLQTNHLPFGSLKMFFVLLLEVRVIQLDI